MTSLPQASARPSALTFDYTLHHLFSAIVEHPGWSTPKVIDIVAADAEDAATVVRAAFGSAAVPALITPLFDVINAMNSMPVAPVARLFWSASQNGPSCWVQADNRGNAAKSHHAQTGQSANLVMPATDLVDEVHRIARLMMEVDTDLYVSDRMTATEQQAA